MTQEELDALMNAKNLDEIEIEEKNNEISMVKDLNSINIESEQKGVETTETLERIINELDAIKKLLKTNELEKIDIIADDLKNMVFELINNMQYQDIHRQKVERVMNKIIEISNIPEEKLKELSINIAKSAKNIDEEKLDNDDIEKLLEQYNN